MNDSEPQPEGLVETPPPPAHLSGEARALWVSMLPQMIRNGMISEVDLRTFGAYCQAQGRWMIAESYILKQGEVLISPNGFPIQNPYLAVANKAMEQSLKREAEFGMTPSSRSRVSSTGAGKKKNRFLELVGAQKTKRRA